MLTAGALKLFLFISQFVHASPFISIGIVHFITNARKIVEVLSNFAIFALKQLRRLVKAYYEAKHELQKGKEHNSVRVRGRAPKAPVRRIAPAAGTKSRRARRAS